MKNKKRFFGAVSALCLFGVGSANATLIFSDSFGYGVASTLAGNGAWTSLNSGTAPVISAGSLSVSGLANSAGNKVSFAVGNIQEALAGLGSTTASDTVFYSFALQLSALPTATTYSFALANSNTLYGATVFFRADTGGVGFNIGMANKSSTAVPSYDPGVYSLNSTIFLVGSYTFVTGTGNDTSSLWINPTNTSFGATTAPTAALTVSGGSDLANINQFLLRGANGSPSGLVDELRIATTWGEVTPVPEPSAYALMLGGLVLAGVTAVRRRGIRVAG